MPVSSAFFSLPARFMVMCSVLVAFGLLSFFLAGCGGGGSSTPTVQPPSFSPVGGTYTSAQTVTLSDATPSATIYYSVDGSIPTTASHVYAAPISVTATTTINAIAAATGDTTSSVASSVYTITVPVAATPTFSPGTGSYASAQSVTISDTTAGATIYYTLDGSAPTSKSLVYSAPIAIPATAAVTTINAIAVATGYTTSAVGTATYTIALPQAATPTFSPVAGSFTSAQTVSISDSTMGATIYYTTNGSTPTAQSAVYSGPIQIPATPAVTTIKAIAAATGYTNSMVASATYTITYPQAATPTFSPAGGNYTSAQTVSIADATAGATIYYTTDGSSPTGTSLVYSGPISINSTTALNAIAEGAGLGNSAVATAVYTITLPPTATPTFSLPAGNYTSAQSVTVSDTTPGAVIYYTTDGTTPTAASPVYAGAISITATSTTLEAIAIAPGDAPSTVASATYTIGAAAPTVSVVLSTHDQTSLMAPQQSVVFGTSPASTNQLFIDESQQYQTIEGFGAAFTEASAYLLEQVVPTSALPQTLSDLFTRTGSGIGLSFMRNPMGATDLAQKVYSFDDNGGTPDLVTLPNFSLAGLDQTYVLPLVQKAKQLNPQMKLMANPWSPPGWMKNTNTMDGGSLLASQYTAFTNYFIKYLQAYQAAGVLPDYISLQNEPLNDTTGYPSMYMDATTQTTVLRDYILPALTAANLPTKVFVYDHNWDTPSYPDTVLYDPVIRASPQVAGVAWHGYAGTPGMQQVVANFFTTKGTWETEHSGGPFTLDQFTTDFTEITHVLRNSSKSFVKWGLALDQNHGPNLAVDVPGMGGCAICNPIITVNNPSGTVTKTVEYYTLGHYSKYILPGAIRVWSSDTPTVVSVAFINPDNSRALIAFNNAASSQTFQVQWGSQNFSYSLPGHAAATFSWTGAQSGTIAQPAKQQVQGASYSTQSGVATEPTTDTTGSYDVGYINGGGYTLYNKVDFGAGASQVNVRVASAGGGGTIQFYLDSMSGTPIATATVANTGGWQKWTNVTAPVVGASGVHNLYVVYGGNSPSGLFNMNWFQFQ